MSSSASLSPRIAWTSNSSSRCSIRSNAAEYEPSTHSSRAARNVGPSSEPVSPEPDALEANSSSTGIGSSCAVITQFSPTTHSSAISSASSSPFGAYAVTTMYRP